LGVLACERLDRETELEKGFRILTKGHEPDFKAATAEKQAAQLFLSIFEFEISSNF